MPLLLPCFESQVVQYSCQSSQKRASRNNCKMSQPFYQTGWCATAVEEFFWRKNIKKTIQRTLDQAEYHINDEKSGKMVWLDKDASSSVGSVSSVFGILNTYFNVAIALFTILAPLHATSLATFELSLFFWSSLPTRTTEFVCPLLYYFWSVTDQIRLTSFGSDASPTRTVAIAVISAL